MKPSVLILPVLLEDALALDVCKSGCRQGSVKGKLQGAVAFDVCENLCAGKAASKASLKGTAKGVELDVKPSAPTSMPLRVRFGTGSPTGTVVNPMFAQDGTASRYISPPLLHLHLLLLLGSVCCLFSFSILIGHLSPLPVSCLQ